MIRPLTCICVLMAAGSGLYLYQTKHDTLVLDARIGAVLKQVDEARARTRALRTRYDGLEQPDRVTSLSARFLHLGSASPEQFVQLSALDAHLPPVTHFAGPAELAQLHAAETQAAGEPAMEAGDQIADAGDGDGAPDGIAAVAVAVREPGHGVTPAWPGARAYAMAQAPHVQARPRRDETAQGTAQGQAVGVAQGQAVGQAVAQAMPLAAPRNTPRMMATSALRPAGPPARAPVTRTGYDYTPRAPGRAAQDGQSVPGGRSVLGGQSVLSGQSMLGGGGMAMAPPVPVAN